LEPLIQLAKRLRPKLVQTLLCPNFDLHEAGVLEHLEMLRHLGLLKVETFCDVPHRMSPSAKQLDDAEPVGLRQRGECPDHDYYIPHEAYACQGIYVAHRTMAGRAASAPANRCITRGRERDRSDDQGRAPHRREGRCARARPSPMSEGLG